jgi:hypothetical protein
VRPLSQLRAVILQASANPGEVAVFLFENARLRGPAAFSTLGMRIQNEQSGSTSLFAQPMSLEPIAESQTTEQAEESLDSQKGTGFSPYINPEILAGALALDAPESQSPTPAKLPRGLLEARVEAALASLTEPSGAPSPTIRQAHLALLKRWYYRPEARRTGEIFFPDAEGRWPIKSILRGVGRVAAKMLTSGDQA